MGLAFAALHWTPAVFQNSTPHEFWAGYEIYLEMNKAPDDAAAK